MKMTNAAVEIIIKETFDNILHLRRIKGAEYSEEGDALANFRRNGADMTLPMEMIWRVFAGKHWDAVSQHVRDISSGITRILSEPIEGRIDDLIMYLCLLKAILCERRCQTETGASSEISKATTTWAELAARVIELEGELARMRTSLTPMSAVERAQLLAERQRKHYEERKGVLPEMTFRDAECHARAARRSAQSYVKVEPVCLVEGAG
jgi:hypothetical protein